MAAHGAPKKVAVLGGGDGLAVREILKYPDVEQVTLVDLDAEITRLFSTQELLVALTQTDAFLYRPSVSPGGAQ